MNTEDLELSKATALHEPNYAPLDLDQPESAVDITKSSSSVPTVKPDEEVINTVESEIHLPKEDQVKASEATPAKIKGEDEEDVTMALDVHSDSPAAALEPQALPTHIQPDLAAELRNEDTEMEQTTTPTHVNPLLDAIDRALHNETVHYSSDEDDSVANAEMSPTAATGQTSSSSESDASNGSESEASDDLDSDGSGSSSDEESDAPVNTNSGANPRKRANNDDMDLSDDETGGPVVSKHELLDEPAPKIPEDLSITEQTQLEFVGDIIKVTGKTIIISAAVSGEFRVLEEKSVFCLEDRKPLGVLYETFGRVQAPLYTVKFDSTEAADEYKSKIGEKVYYVVSASKFLFTDSIKNLKGSDASNLHDEEIPTEEQEYSDDEIERMNNMKKKKKKTKKVVEGKQEESSSPRSAGPSDQNNRSRGRKNHRGGSHAPRDYSQHPQGPSNQGYRPQPYQQQQQQQPYQQQPQQQQMSQPFYNYNGGNNPMYMNQQQQQQYPMPFPQQQQQQQQWNPMQSMMAPQQQQQALQQQFQMMQQYMSNQQSQQQFQYQQQQQQHNPQNQNYNQNQNRNQNQNQQQQQQQQHHNSHRNQNQPNSTMYNGGGGGPGPSSSRAPPRSYDSPGLNYDEN